MAALDDQYRDWRRERAERLRADYEKFSRNQREEWSKDFESWRNDRAKSAKAGDQPGEQALNRLGSTPAMGTSGEET